MVSKATRQLAALPLAGDTPTISEFTTDISNQTTMDNKIRTEYEELLKEPIGLPPRRPRFGDFKIRLLPGSVAPYRAPRRSARKRRKGTAHVMEVEEGNPMFSEKGYLRDSCKGDVFFF